ncbi:hypothetical protein BCR44DRAFT_1027856 [Catenaria anguillulae PL171]|uniref:Secreted protein n=1 Tax=Catenaria anguillulae PL171 TaxID=765915 RepID=A0A1Y2HTI0_9FUNG|nr:hypothetical protein BCR44DRAFT_1027856 [Catenaria anguillulae PL171]
MLNAFSLLLALPASLPSQRRWLLAGGGHEEQPRSPSIQMLCTWGCWHHGHLAHADAKTVKRLAIKSRMHYLKLL